MQKNKFSLKQRLPLIQALQASRSSIQSNQIPSWSSKSKEHPSSAELLHKLAVELLNPTHPLRTRRQESRPEMQRALLLPKPTTRHNADAGSLEQAHAVELVRVLAGLLGGVDGLLRQRYGREQVHGARGRGAGHALHLLEGVVQGVGAGFEAGKDVVVFFLVLRVRGGAFLRWVHHYFDHALADDGGAEHDADEFVDLFDNLGGDDVRIHECEAIKGKSGRLLTLGSKPTIS
jgi:hypothetical protein